MTKNIFQLYYLRSCTTFKVGTVRRAGAEGKNAPGTVQPSTATLPTTLVLGTKILHQIAALHCQRILGKQHIKRYPAFLIIYTLSFKIAFWRKSFKSDTVIQHHPITLNLKNNYNERNMLPSKWSLLSCNSMF